MALDHRMILQASQGLDAAKPLALLQQGKQNNRIFELAMQDDVRKAETHKQQTALGAQQQQLNDQKLRSFESEEERNSVLEATLLGKPYLDVGDHEGFTRQLENRIKMLESRGLSPHHSKAALEAAKAGRWDELKQGHDAFLTYAAQIGLIDPPKQQSASALELERLKLDGQRLRNDQIKQSMDLAKGEAERKSTESQVKVQAQDVKLQEAEAKKAQQQDSMRAKAGFVNQQLQIAANQAKEAFAGRMGQIGAFLSPTGDSANLRRTLETIKSNVGFNELIKMKSESPTGGALGAVSNIELQQLNASLGSLDAMQSDEELFRVLQQVNDVFSRISQSAGGEPLPPLDIGQQQQPVGRSGQGGNTFKSRSGIQFTVE